MVLTNLGMTGQALTEDRKFCKAYIDRCEMLDVGGDTYFIALYPPKATTE